MTKWLILIVLIISGGVLWYLYDNIENLEKIPGDVPNSSPSIVRITHAFQDDVHRFSGEIKLPHSCYAVKTVVIPDTATEHGLVISITTTDRMLEESICVKISTRYPFEIIAEAPKDVSYTLQVDEKETPIRVTEVNWASAEGTILNPI